MVGTHVAQMCACARYNNDNKKLQDDYLRLVSDQETLAELFTSRVHILKFATCNEDIKTRFKDMYCLGISY